MFLADTARVVDENARAVESLAETSTNQVNAADSVSKNADKLGEELDVSKTLINEANASVKEAGTYSEEGRKIVENLDRITRDSNTKALAIESGVRDVESAINDVVNFVDTIRSISEQTNLLALNASIEAAQAGDAGRGFAVVADEIRKLSVGTNEATEQINGLIVNVKSKVDISVDDAADIKNISVQQTGALQNVSQAFRNIAEKLEELVGRMDRVTSVTDNIDVMKEEIIQAINSMAEMTESVSATYEEISASTEEQTASVQEVSSLAQMNMSMAEKLMAEVKRFKV